MLKPTVRIFVLSIVIYTLACQKPANIQDNYPKDSSLSKPNGELVNSMTFYFPAVIKSDSTVTVTGIDSFWQQAYSAALYNLKEPLLFNFYTGHDIYRFFWERAFHPPMVYTLNKEGNKVWLTVKSLDRFPKFIDEFRRKFVPLPMNSDGSIDTTKEYSIPEPDSIIKADRFAKIVVNKEKKLSLTEWKNFEQLLKQSNFWKMKPSFVVDANDGSRWVLEAHLADKYWFVDRFSPDKGDNHRKCGEYLIKLSEMNERIY
jgi:hypothetical protein